jgi:hypothetical protein
MDPSQTDGRIPIGDLNPGATSFAANPLAFRLDGSRMPASFKAGAANCVFFATVFASCTPPGSSAATSGHQWANYNSPWIPAYNIGGDNLTMKPTPTLPILIPETPTTLECNRAAVGGGPVGYVNVQAFSAAGAQVCMGDVSTRTIAPHIGMITWGAINNPDLVLVPEQEWIR